MKAIVVEVVDTTDPDNPGPPRHRVVVELRDIVRGNRLVTVEVMQPTLPAIAAAVRRALDAREKVIGEEIEV